MAPISDLLDNLPPYHEPRTGYHFDFLALPGELRNYIYRLTLTTDPAMLDREHKYSCYWCTWDPDEPQNPMYDANHQKLPGCRCWAREGLALLLANRQINEEAAPMFWAENHFSFRGYDNFIHLVGTALRPRYRQMIPHVTICSDPRGMDNLRRPPIGLWDTLFQCKGLRTLEIPAFTSLVPDFTNGRQRLLEAEYAACNRFASELPNLTTFCWMYLTGDPTESPDAISYPYTVTKHMDAKALTTDKFSLYDMLADRSFWWAMCRTAFPRAPCYAAVDDALVSTGRPHEYRYTGGMTGRNNMFGATHFEAMPATWTVKYHLLPLSPETIARNSVLKARDQNSKKAGK